MIDKFPELIQMLLENVGKMAIAQETPEMAEARQKLTNQLQIIMKELSALSGVDSGATTDQMQQLFSQMSGMNLAPLLEKK